MEAVSGGSRIYHTPTLGSVVNSIKWNHTTASRLCWTFCCRYAKENVKKFINAYDYLTLMKVQNF
uniref:Uncharacterized protein n=1 Tax=Brassica campestris TaxID=3711 RepID=M4DCP0_BRACM